MRIIKKKKMEEQHEGGVVLRVNPCLLVLNVVFGCMGIGLVSVGVWLSLNHGTSCVHFLQTVLIWAGMFMVGVAAAGIVGAIWRIVWLLYLNFLVMFLLLLLLVSTTVFVLLVTSHAISAADRYPHAVFSDWLRDQVNQRIDSCTQNGQICQLVRQSYANGYYYSRPRLSALQTACCEAPADCNGDESAASVDDADCEAWREAGVSTGFCSRCSLCKAAVAENIRHVWHAVAIFKVIALLILVPAYFVTCCHFKQDEHGDGNCRRCLDCCFNVL